ncbi:hypothetical protein SNE40_004912 [Patella caerulea]|uniref:Uncharacterized protein n=1 Tax=Patella caerulea TaxID=87958 RepID=A0AAN8Q651_PATCE
MGSEQAVKEKQSRIKDLESVYKKQTLNNDAESVYKKQTIVVQNFDMEKKLRQRKSLRLAHLYLSSAKMGRRLKTDSKTRCDGDKV